ncbi:MAG: choice-of-anchor L domain-containing protein [Cyanobacteria bacterium]|nr:choice-of-anchor L domain-containing protein [Cyanobacteriota bacterium]
MSAQQPGRNVNMVSGTTYPDGDPHLQRQNEPSLAASTRNPLHLMAGSNDYRTVDIPFPDDGEEETGDAWLGLFKSTDGGQRWKSGLLPGYPQDQSVAGLASPLKGYQAGADPVVRAGTHGLFYYSGLAFNRGENGKSAIFLARFIDNNNKENGDPIAYLGTTIVAASTGARFLDKPWMTVDIPRGDAVTCYVSADNVLSTHQPVHKSRWWRRKKPHVSTPNEVQRIPAGAVYVSFSSITGEGTGLKSEIYLTRSMDCGQTWSTPLKVSRPEDGINQGTNITIDPRTGAVFVAWRRFSPFTTAQNPNPPDNDAIMVARLPFGGKKFDPPSKVHDFPKPKVRRTLHELEELFEHRRKDKQEREREKYAPRAAEAGDVSEFDQGSTSFTFRTNAYPTMTADGTGRVYVAWTQRGFPTDTSASEGARILIATTRDGRTFTQPRAADNNAQLGHQLMPTLAFAGGKLMLVYYDLRETRAGTHAKFVSDQNTISGLRQTIDIRAAMASPGDDPHFAPSVKVSDYLMGLNPKTGLAQALQVNPPNLPMFRQGTTPFMGDYIDVAAAPAFVPIGNGKWGYNTAADTAFKPVFHAAWTDNRDVRPPKNGDWTQYTPARMSSTPPGRPSLFDPSVTVPQCEDGNAGSRNQNVYSSRITQGLLVGSPGNAKPLSTALQRGFVVFAQNSTAELRRFRMTIRSQPPGGRASFEQFGGVPVVGLDMAIPPRSTASRTVYATSTNADANIIVDVIEIASPGTPSLNLGGTVVLNPDVENPDVENPDTENTNPANPDVENAEVYNPDVENPDVENPDVENPGVLSARIANPDVENPDVENPDVENPDVENVRVANPDIENLTITNPDVENPDVENPDVENPDVENPDVENGAIADVTWQVGNTGNTTAAFNVNVFLAQQTIPAGIKTQLILYKTYRTPVTVPNGCQLGFQTRNVLISSILNPAFIQPSGGGPFDQNDPSEKNPTMWLAPGEEGRITLRVIDDDLSNNLIITKPDGSTISIDPAFAPTASITPTVSSQGVGTDDKAAGKTDPPLVTPTGANLFFLHMPALGTSGEPLSPPLSVQVRDNLTGTPVANATVTLALGSNPGAATIAGNAAISDVTGIATFPALTISAPGEGYTLVASALANGSIATATSLPFTISGPLAIVTTALSAGTAGLPYIETVQSTGGVGVARTWSVADGSLPPGLTLNVATGGISGTISPLARGTYNFVVRVQDVNVPPHSATRSLSIAVVAMADLSLGLSDSPDPVDTNAPLTYTITVANAGPSTATNVTVTDTLPSSVNFVSASEGCQWSETGVVSCALGLLGPLNAAQVTIVVSPRDPGTIENTASVAAIEADPISNNTAAESTEVRTPVDIAMPSIGERTAQSGVPYALTFLAGGGTAPYTWSLLGGSLPTGLSFNPELGALSGTPTATGAFTFTVRAQDSLGSSDTLTVCVTVRLPLATQLSTASIGEGLTIENVVTSLLGQGVSVSNIRLNGQSVIEGSYIGAGVFEGAAGILGIDTGIMLSSGSVHLAKGPNDSDNTSVDLRVGEATDGDDDLTALARSTGTNASVVTHDATVLEFDFVPSGDTVSFRYVFGSEEYNEFVASQYNDAFGFFITDPNGVKRNFALVPNTEEPVTINSINGGNPFGTITARNTHLYRNNDPNDPAATINIEADGLTVVLTLTATVTPGQLHTMKLAIADAGDSGYDSWVFIEGGSFRAVENCGNGVDDDGDGLIDGADPDCQSCLETEGPAGQDQMAASAIAAIDQSVDFAPVSYAALPAVLARRRRTPPGRS